MLHAVRIGRLGLLMAGLLGLCSVAQAQVGVSVEISQPGVYGRVDIGGLPRPRLIVPQPVVIAPVQRQFERPEPVYLWVPQDHRRNWRRHCGEYRACGVPVYFVQDNWYHEHVHRGDERGRGHRHGHDHRGDGRDDGGRDDDRGGRHGGGDRGRHEGR